jgi:7-keto-8-aminopelargonate synthetase-like enzyme
MAGGDYDNSRQRHESTMMIMQSAPGAETVIDGRRYLYFVGTGYLGLHGHPDVVNAACEATRQYGLGSATSRAGYGNTPPTLDVERCSAEFFGAEDAFYFASGYVGNHLLACSLLEETDAIFLDACAHYSEVEASRLTGLPVFRFPHADADGLCESLQRNLRAGWRPLVMSDGVFAALGTIAPAIDYCDVLRNYAGSALSLDDCHAFGVLGDHGRGTFEHLGLHGNGVNTVWQDEANATRRPHLFTTATLSKAFGGYGGIICGSRAYIEHIKTTSHYFDGASAPPIPAAAASARAIRLVADDPSIIAQLRQNVYDLKGKLRELGLQTDDSPVPIICLTLGSSDNMQRIQQALMREGILIAYRKSYSGLGSEGALRIAVFSTHTRAMIDALIDAIRRTI